MDICKCWDYRIKMRRVVVVIIFLFFTALLSAQTHSTVDVFNNSEVYILLESAQLRGLIPIINQIKPWSKSIVKNNLELLDLQIKLLSNSEKKILNLYLDKYTIKNNLTFSAIITSDNNLNTKELNYPHSINALGLKLESDILNNLSMDIEFSMMLDRTNEEAFLPNNFTKTWDHHHMDVEERADLSYEEFAISNRGREEITFADEEGENYIRLGRFRRDWGPGDNSLLLSGTARPFIGLDTGFNINSFLYFFSTTGSLGQTVSADSDSEQKMISAHKLTLLPLPWLSISVWESVIFGKRLEMGYLSPVSIYMVSQMGIAGDKDNATLGFDFNAEISSFGKFYGSVFIDEIEHDKIEELFTYPKNMFAYYAGFKAAVPGIPFGVVTFQYTKLEPFVYTHYKQDYPIYNIPININYTNDGENLGYPLPPNSDEFKLLLSFLPLPDLNADLGITYTRHGNNPDAGETEYLIMGDIEEPLSYPNMADYPDKDFLNDGIYEKIFSIYGTVSYNIPNFPLKIYAGYGFSYSRNSGNIPGVNKFQNVISLGGSFRQQIW